MKCRQSGSSVLGNYSRPGRSGFTLIEILIVMVIVLILAGLLLGAAVLVRARVTGAQQMAELTQIGLAIEKFKGQYGFYPPSRIRLREWSVGGAISAWTPAQGASPLSAAYSLDDPFDAHSVAYLRRIWPNIRLPISQTSGGALVETPTEDIRWYVDESGLTTPAVNVYDLEGDQCLVFFLGGVTQRIGQSQFVLHGFTDDGSNPSRVPNGNQPKTITRTPKFFEFDAGRLYVRNDFGVELVDFTSGRSAETAAAGLDFYTTGVNHQSWPGPSPIRLGTMPSIKAIGTEAGRPLPIAYFSSYEGRGYRPDDLNIPASPNVATPTDTTIFFQLVWPRLTGPNPAISGQTLPVSPTSLGPNPFTRTLANPTTVNQIVQGYNPQGFQLILPGADGEFGGGGSQQDYTAASSTTAWNYNVDNITNFSAGKPIGEFIAGQ